jgi:hypothetical protein
MTQTTRRIAFIVILCVALQPLQAGAKENVPDSASQNAPYDPRASTRMTQAADEPALKAFEAANPRDYYVFTEDRSEPIRRNDLVPAHWVSADHRPLDQFAGTAQPGEFYFFQLGLFAASADVGPIDIAFEDLKAEGTIPSANFRCLNLGGVDFVGRPFHKVVTVKQGRVQALWIGADIPQSAKGTYQGRLIVRPEGGKPTPVSLKMEVAGPPVEDHGDLDSWRLSRLRWLDSTIGLDDNAVVAPFLPLQRDGDSIRLLGRRIELDASGLPGQVTSYFNADNTRIDDHATDVLARPLRLIVETDQGAVAFRPSPIRFTREQKGAIEWASDWTADGTPGLSASLHGLIEFDGYLRYRISVKSERETTLKDVRLESDFSPAASTYFMGLNHRGGVRPASIDWKWDPGLNQDGFWIGAVNAGMKLRLKGANFRTPLVNAYYHYRELAIPESWGNAGKGGVRLRTADGGGAEVAAFSGARTLHRGEEQEFDFDLFLTPFKPIDTDAQWRNRYFHPHQGQDDPDLRDPSRIKAMGATVINIHHNKEPNPVINYPYYDRSVPILQKCVADAHVQGLKVKIYYTAREITNNLPELWAFKSLGEEIIQPGPGAAAKPVTNPHGPHPWLIENLRDDFIPAWREELKGRYDGMLDLAVLTTPDSRIDNFYLEGLAFTLKHAGIDGLYIDDTALGRKSFQRARRILDAATSDGQIDMHSWSHFNNLAGMTPSAYQYMENYPYTNRIWYGEGFSYDTPPDQWLIEMSGIPFGLLGEMMGEHPFKGMVFGATSRLAWSGNPRGIWKLWDDFGMAGSDMIGFWDNACPVKTGNPQVPATVYRKPGKCLIALANWGKTDATVRLNLDWKALGLDPARVTLRAPEIGPQVQAAQTFAAGDELKVPPGKGWLLIAEEGAVQR